MVELNDFAVVPEKFLDLPERQRLSDGTPIYELYDKKKYEHQSAYFLVVDVLKAHGIFLGERVDHALRGHLAQKMMDDSEKWIEQINKINRK